MKKFLSMVMAAAMVVSLVPATAFAANGDFKATAKLIDAQNFPVDGVKSPIGGSELQLTLTTGDTLRTQDKMKFTATLDNVKDLETVTQIEADDIFILDEDGRVTKDYTVKDFDVTDEDEFEFTVEEKGDAESAAQFKRGIVIGIDLSGVQMDKVSKGKTATISIDSDDATITNGDDLVFASVEAKGIKASVKDTVDIATEEVATIKDVKLETAVGDTFKSILPAGSEVKLKLSSGFEFTNKTLKDIFMGGSSETSMSSKISLKEADNDEIIFSIDQAIDTDTLKIRNVEIEATSAKAGSTATLKVYATGCDTVSVEVAKVVDYTVSMTVDEDEDVPVIYSGVDVDNTGITDDSDHDALEVTLEETFAGAWNNSKDFTLELPEGVYVADVTASAENAGSDVDGDTKAWFKAAYDEGNYVDLTFKRRGWEETNPDDSSDKIEINFTLKLVADPNFEGDVVLKLTGDAVDEQEVTIAKFVKPFVVEAQQNDMQIDYRNTEIPTSVVIKEAEAGLWDKNTQFTLELDKINFDDEGTIAVDDKSGLEIKDDEVKLDSKNYDNDVIYFTVDSRSDDEPAVVTISGLQLYMDRSLPAGAYDLNAYALTMLGVDSAEEAESFDGSDYDADDKGYLPETLLAEAGTDVFVGDESDDIDYTVKTGFVNIVTAGSDTTGFTTKLTVPIGENYLIAGETQVTLDAPAYINDEGYTMLPVRAISTSLGIDNNNVLWDQATRTVTILYGDRIISMTAGASVMYVNGSSIPTSSSVEIVNDRTFLPMRDLATALGVTDLTWDTDPTTGKTTTVYMNANR